VVRQYGAREAIATSSGQNDSGLFELSFHDDRYLPFEYEGAISRWRLELPAENNYFNMDTLSDVVMHLNYTAREGGSMLRHAAARAAACKLPACGWVLIDIRYDQPDTWARFRAAHRDRDREPWLDVWLDRNMFPYIPCADGLRVDRVMLMFEADCEHECRCRGECACREDRGPAAHEVRHRDLRRDSGDDRRDRGRTVDCVEILECRGLYEGLLDADIEVGHALGCERGMSFQFPPGAMDVTRVYLFCHYELA
jgi:Tc toxin complex TcA C-terminal TcB-binding domain